MRPLCLLLLPLVLAPQARAAEADVLAALDGELVRSMDELVLPDADAPYFGAYTLYDTHTAYAEASFGSLLRSGANHRRPLRAELRVGSYRTDNTNFSSFGEDPAGVTGASLVLDDDPLAIRRDLWVVTDAAYKSAVEGLSLKLAAREQSTQEERSPDFSAAPVVVHVEPGTHPVPVEAAMAELARALSRPMKDHPRVEYSRAYASEVSWHRYLVNSEGTRVVDGGSMMVVRAIAEARADDGALVKDGCSWMTRGEHPPMDELEAAVHGMLDRLDATVAAEEIDEYLGPVVFEDQAAAELFRQLLVPQLMGTPAEETDGAWDMGGGGLPLARLGRRVLPAGFDVWDDPAGAPHDAVGAYTLDAEGVRAQRVDLVDAGVVQSLLMSRTPRDDIERSNGHGRGGISTRTVGMPGAMTVEGHGGLSRQRLLKQAHRMARQSGLDHVLLVRALDDPALRTASTVRRIRFGDDSGLALTDPLQVVRLYADGTEVPLRGASFLLGDHRVLRDIVATGNDQTEHDYLAPPVLHGGTSWVAGPTTGVPVTLSTPSLVLISEMEIGPRSGRKAPAPLLPSPLAQAN